MFSISPSQWCLASTTLGRSPSSNKPHSRWIPNPDRVMQRMCTVIWLLHRHCVKSDQLRSRRLGTNRWQQAYQNLMQIPKHARNSSVQPISSFRVSPLHGVTSWALLPSKCTKRVDTLNVTAALHQALVSILPLRPKSSSMAAPVRMRQKSASACVLPATVGCSM